MLQKSVSIAQAMGRGAVRIIALVVALFGLLGTAQAPLPDTLNAG